jgi:hypothetical protein
MNATGSPDCPCVTVSGVCQTLPRHPDMSLARLYMEGRDMTPQKAHPPTACRPSPSPPYWVLLPAAPCGR